MWGKHVMKIDKDDDKNFIMLSSDWATRLALFTRYSLW